MGPGTLPGPASLGVQTISQGFYPAGSTRSPQGAAPAQDRLSTRLGMSVPGR